MLLFRMKFLAEYKNSSLKTFIEEPVLSFFLVKN